MSVIGYFITCARCEVKMIVTVEARDTRHCPDCLNEILMEAIESDLDDPVPYQPYETSLLPWEVELLGRNDDDDYPIGEVRG